MAKTEKNSSCPFIVLHGATFRVGERVVFKRTNWQMLAREQWAVVGRNGSGKSLLAAALQGTLPLVEGDIEYHFGQIGEGGAEQRISSVSFEDQRGLAGDSLAAARWFSLEQEESAAVADLLTFDSVEEINPFVVADHRVARIDFERRLKGVVRALGIAPLLNRRLVQLSNGEMRKLLIARALLKQPKLLILDDPMAGLDATYRVQFHKILATLSRRKDMRLLLMVTRAEDLPTSVTHLALVERCRLIAQGPKATMLRDKRVRALFAVPRLKQKAVSRTSEAGRELIRLEDVRLAFGSKTVLRGLTWTVREGESWAIVGRNGAGKSALMSLIAGNLSPASARAFALFGRRRGTGESRTWVRRHIGEVSPELHLHFDLNQSVLEAVLTGFTDTLQLMSRPSSKRRTEAMKWLRRFGLQRHTNTAMRDLSAGKQRMVLLARALARKPALLLLDEPGQGLDAQNRRLFMQAVEELVRRRATILYTTHRADEIPPSIRRSLTIRQCRALLA